MLPDIWLTIKVIAMLVCIAGGSMFAMGIAFFIDDMINGFISDDTKKDGEEDGKS